MKQVDFGSEKVAYNIAQTAFPLMIAQLLQLLYNIVDRVYIGRIPDTGTSALGAVGLVFPVIIIITGLTNLFGLGGSPLFAIALGEGDREKAARIMNSSFRLLVLAAIVVTFLSELFAAPLLRLFGADEEMLVFSLPYARIYLTGTVFTMVASGMNPFINAQGYPQIGMTTIMVGAATNLILDPIFIFALGLGVRGAAIATVIAQALSFLFVLRFFHGARTMFPVRLFPTEKEKEAGVFPYASDICGLGVASFIMQATNSLVQIVCNKALLVHGGALYVSVMTVVSSVRNILDTPPLTISDGTAPIISFNYGAKHPMQLKNAVRIMTIVEVSYTALIWILLEWRAEWFVRLFSPDVALHAIAARALRIYFRAFVFQALQYCGQTVFKALGYKRQAIFFSLFRKVALVVPLIFLFSFTLGLGTDGVFWAEPVSNLVGGLACFLTMIFALRRVLREMQ